MRKVKYDWTWNGEEKSPKELSVILGYTSITPLYEIVKIVGSARGEDLQAYQQKQRREREKKMVTFEGKKMTHAEIAVILGMEPQTLSARLAKYGPDCCLTYFPGRIPARLYKRFQAISKKNRKIGIGGKAKGSWCGLGGNPRTKNLSKIKNPGTWELEQLSAEG